MTPYYFVNILTIYICNFIVFETILPDHIIKPIVIRGYRRESALQHVN